MTVFQFHCSGKNRFSLPHHGNYCKIALVFFSSYSPSLIMSLSSAFTSRYDKIFRKSLQSCSFLRLAILSFRSGISRILITSCFSVRDASFLLGWDPSRSLGKRCVSRSSLEKILFLRQFFFHFNDFRLHMLHLHIILILICAVVM